MTQDGPVKKHLAEMTFEEAEAALAKTDTGIVVVAATEQHGPHCAMGLDYLCAEKVAALTAEQVDCVVCPVLPIGFSRQWMNYAGSLTLRRDTFQAMVEDVVNSLIWHGVNRVVILNGHGRNSFLLNDLCLKVRYATGALVTHVDWWKIARFFPQEAGLTNPTEDLPIAHAAEEETSALLALAEEQGKQLVHMDRAPKQKFPHRPFPEAPELTTSPTETPITITFKPFGGYQPSLGLDGTEYTEQGVVGNPHGATAEKGRRSMAMAADRIAQYIRALQKVSVQVHTRPRFY